MRGKQTTKKAGHKSERNLGLVYAAVVTGIYIQGISGTLYTEDEWNNQETVNGIAVESGNCSFVFRGYENITRKMYETNTVYPDLPQMNSSDRSSDLDGKGNTEKLIEAFGDANTHAAGYCYNYIFPNGNRGYLPALGECYDIALNNEKIDNLLSLAGLNPISDMFGFAWTSTRAEDNGGCRFWDTDMLESDGQNLANSSNYVLPFSPLISPSDIIEFAIGGTTYKCVKGTTWANWCSSAFNTAGIYIDGTTVKGSGGNLGSYSAPDVTIGSTEEIIANGKYYVDSADAPA